MSQDQFQPTNSRPGSYIKTEYGVFDVKRVDGVLHIKLPLGSVVLIGKTRFGYINVKLKKYRDKWELLCEGGHGSSYNSAIGYQLPLEEDQNYRWTNAQRNEIVSKIVKAVEKVMKE
jgi:hypothetical protein